MKTWRAYSRLLAWALAACIASNGCGRGAPVPKDASDEEKQQAIADMYAGYRESFPDVPEVTVAEALEMQATGKVVFVDVREPEEYAVSHIPGAVSATEFERDPDAYRDATVIAYCTIGYRSGEYAAKLREKGIDACNLDGSILSWAHAGKPLMDDKGETKRLHVYGKRWDLAPKDFETVW
jgi:rhodanese-related sulfurtransferase